MRGSKTAILSLQNIFSPRREKCLSAEVIGSLRGGNGFPSRRDEYLSISNRNEWRAFWTLLLCRFSIKKSAGKLCVGIGVCLLVEWGRVPAEAMSVRNYSLVLRHFVSLWVVYVPVLV